MSEVLLAAVTAATTIEQFEAARAEIRRTFTPQEVDASLWAACEKKRIELEGEGDR